AKIGESVSPTGLILGVVSKEGIALREEAALMMVEAAGVLLTPSAAAQGFLLATARGFMGAVAAAINLAGGPDRLTWLSGGGRYAESVIGKDKKPIIRAITKIEAVSPLGVTLVEPVIDTLRSGAVLTRTIGTQQATLIMGADGGVLAGTIMDATGKEHDIVRGGGHVTGNFGSVAGGNITEVWISGSGFLQGKLEGDMSHPPIPGVDSKKAGTGMGIGQLADGVPEFSGAGTNVTFKYDEQGKLVMSGTAVFALVNPGAKAREGDDWAGLTPLLGAGAKVSVQIGDKTTSVDTTRISVTSLVTGLMMMKPENFLGTEAGMKLGKTLGAAVVEGFLSPVATQLETLAQGGKWEGFAEFAGTAQGALSFAMGAVESGGTLISIQQPEIGEKGKWSCSVSVGIDTSDISVGNGKFGFSGTVDVRVDSTGKATLVGGITLRGSRKNEEITFLAGKSFIGFAKGRVMLYGEVSVAAGKNAYYDTLASPSAAPGAKDPVPEKKIGGKNDMHVGYNEHGQFITGSNFTIGSNGQFNIAAGTRVIFLDSFKKAGAMLRVQGVDATGTIPTLTMCGSWEGDAAKFTQDGFAVGQKVADFTVTEGALAGSSVTEAYQWSLGGENLGMDGVLTTKQGAKLSIFTGGGGSFVLTPGDKPALCMIKGTASETVATSKQLQTFATANVWGDTPLTNQQAAKGIIKMGVAYVDGQAKVREGAVDGLIQKANSLTPVQVGAFGAEVKRATGQEMGAFDAGMALLGQDIFTAENTVETGKFTTFMTQIAGVKTEEVGKIMGSVNAINMDTLTPPDKMIQMTSFQVFMALAGMSNPEKSKFLADAGKVTAGMIVNGLTAKDTINKGITQADQKIKVTGMQLFMALAGMSDGERSKFAAGAGKVTSGMITDALTDIKVINANRPEGKKNIKVTSMGLFMALAGMTDKERTTFAASAGNITADTMNRVETRIDTINAGKEGDKRLIQASGLQIYMALAGMSESDRGTFMAGTNRVDAAQVNNVQTLLNEVSKDMGKPAENKGFQIFMALAGMDVKELKQFNDGLKNVGTRFVTKLVDSLTAKGIEISAFKAVMTLANIGDKTEIGKFVQKIERLNLGDIQTFKGALDKQLVAFGKEKVTMLQAAFKMVAYCDFNAKDNKLNQKSFNTMVNKINNLTTANIGQFRAAAGTRVSADGKTGMSFEQTIFQILKHCTFTGDDKLVKSDFSQITARLARIERKDVLAFTAAAKSKANIEVSPMQAVFAIATVCKFDSNNNLKGRGEGGAFRKTLAKLATLTGVAHGGYLINYSDEGFNADTTQLVKACGLTVTSPMVKHEGAWIPKAAFEGPEQAHVIRAAKALHKQGLTMLALPVEKKSEAVSSNIKQAFAGLGLQFNQTMVIVDQKGKLASGTTALLIGRKEYVFQDGKMQKTVYTGDRRIVEETDSTGNIVKYTEMAKDGSLTTSELAKTKDGKYNLSRGYVGGALTSVDNFNAWCESENDNNTIPVLTTVGKMAGGLVYRAVDGVVRFGVNGIAATVGAGYEFVSHLAFAVGNVVKAVYGVGMGLTTGNWSTAKVAGHGIWKNVVAAVVGLVWSVDVKDGKFVSEKWNTGILKGGLHAAKALVLDAIIVNVAKTVYQPFNRKIVNETLALKYNDIKSALDAREGMSEKGALATIGTSATVFAGIGTAIGAIPGAIIGAVVGAIVGVGIVAARYFNPDSKVTATLYDYGSGHIIHDSLADWADHSTLGKAVFETTNVLVIALSVLTFGVSDMGGAFAVHEKSALKTSFFGSKKFTWESVLSIGATVAFILATGGMGALRGGLGGLRAGLKGLVTLKGLGAAASNIGRVIAAPFKFAWRVITAPLKSGTFIAKVGAEIRKVGMKKFIQNVRSDGV
ncbi:hypothetical protein ACFL5C_02405, partial [Candidatus Omnitrophota bacterium]